MRVIYSLADPRTDAVRYVGKADSLKTRVQNHLCPSNLRKTKHCSKWLASLVRDGLKPIVAELESLSDTADWEASERRWIKHFKDLGCDLTNITDGGEGGTTYGRRGKSNSTLHNLKMWRARKGRPITYELTQELLKKRGVAIKAHWDGVRASGGKKRGGGKLGGKHSQESIKKMRVNHNPKSDLNLRGRTAGFRSHRRRFSDDQILEIRQRVAAGESQVTVATAFGTRQATISSIVRFETYQDVR